MKRVEEGLEKEKLKSQKFLLQSGQTIAFVAQMTGLDEKRLTVLKDTQKDALSDGPRVRFFVTLGSRETSYQGAFHMKLSPKHIAALDGCGCTCRCAHQPECVQIISLRRASNTKEQSTPSHKSHLSLSQRIHTTC
ncbi:hypothetical protein Bealeia2_02031 (plasmid) [Candidatus Bealeia paramacronuclearis]|nr:hypothetical protein [Candidatus Bealeia paramacronuclearis]